MGTVLEDIWLTNLLYRVEGVHHCGESGCSVPPLRWPGSSPAHCSHRPQDLLSGKDTVHNATVLSLS